MMIFTPGGVLLVSEAGEGKVVALLIRTRGQADKTVTVLQG